LFCATRTALPLRWFVYRERQHMAFTATGYADAPHCWLRALPFTAVLVRWVDACGPRCAATQHRISGWFMSLLRCWTKALSGLRLLGSSFCALHAALAAAADVARVRSRAYAFIARRYLRGFLVAIFDQPFRLVLFHLYSLPACVYSLTDAGALRVCWFTRLRALILVYSGRTA